MERETAEHFLNASELVLFDALLLPRLLEQLFVMIDKAVLCDCRGNQHNLHQSNLMIIEKFVEVQLVVPLMRERNCLSVEETHHSGPSMGLMWR